LRIGKEALLRDCGAGGADANMPIFEKHPPCAFGSDLPDNGCEAPGVGEFEEVLLCEWHIKEVEASEVREHWEEVDLYLDMWLKVAHAKSNLTLSRLLRYAQLEAKVEQEYERKTLKRAVRVGRYEI
jgi:hypothetical protein